MVVVVLVAEPCATSHSQESFLSVHGNSPIRPPRGTPGRPTQWAARQSLARHFRPAVPSTPHTCVSLWLKPGFRLRGVQTKIPKGVAPPHRHLCQSARHWPRPAVPLVLNRTAQPQRNATKGYNIFLHHVGTDIWYLAIHMPTRILLRIHHPS